MAGRGRAKGRAFAAFAALALTVGCRLGGKTACRVDADCIGPRTCEQGGVRRSTAGRRFGHGRLDRRRGRGRVGRSGDSVRLALSRRACSPASDGRPMTCYPASALAGEDFCAFACDPAVPVDDPANTVCDPSGALLTRCHPNGDVTGQADCPQGPVVLPHQPARRRRPLHPDAGLQHQPRLSEGPRDVCRDDRGLGGARFVAAARERPPPRSPELPALELPERALGLLERRGLPGHQLRRPLHRPVRPTVRLERLPARLRL